MDAFSGVLERAFPITARQFALFRIVFGLYLTCHFAALLPFSAELFSNVGVLPNASLNPTHGLFPNVLAWVDSPAFVYLFVSLLALASLSFAAGLGRRPLAILLWYGWACLFNRNVLISNPSIPYVGLLLLLCAVVPPGEPRFPTRGSESVGWRFPLAAYGVAWFLMAAGYTYSGVVKLWSPSWWDGSAMVHLVNNPLARPGLVRDLFLGLPDVLTRAATWFSLAGEILFLPLSLSRATRLIAWSWMVSMHLGILLMVDFMDLTAGMLMIHVFTFDPAWVPERWRRKSLS